MEFFDDSRDSSRASTGNIDSQVELVTNFFSHFTDDKELGYYKSMIVDLYRAITCYRMYDSLDEFMAINPELKDCKEDIIELWQEFDKLTDEELADVALELLQDI